MVIIPAFIQRAGIIVQGLSFFLMTVSRYRWGLKQTLTGTACGTSAGYNEQSGGSTLHHLGLRATDNTSISPACMERLQHSNRELERGSATFSTAKMKLHKQTEE